MLGGDDYDDLVDGSDLPQEMWDGYEGDERQAGLQEKQDRWDREQVDASAVVNFSRRDFLRTTTAAGTGVLVLGVFGCSQDELAALPDVFERAAATGNYTDAPFKPSVFVGLNANGDVFVVLSLGAQRYEGRVYPPNE